MPNTKNNLPLYAEELTLYPTQTNIQQILSQFQQQIPSNFIKLELEEGNYCGPTNPKWKNKPFCERYGFDHEGEWRQIDIPHDLMEKLGLEKGPEIKQPPLYLDPAVLTRPETYKGITIKEEEIFLEQPFAIKKLEKNLTQLFEKVAKLEEREELSQKTIQNYLQKITALEGEKELERNNARKEIAEKDDQIKHQKEVIDKTIAELKEQKKELEEQEALLNKEKKTVGTQTDPYVDQHLTADIQRLEQEKKDLDQQIEELKNQAQSDKLARDKELADLKQADKELNEKVTNLTTQLNNAIKVDETIYNLLGQHSSKDNLLERTQEVVEKIGETTRILNYLKNSITENESQLIQTISHVFSLSTRSVFFGEEARCLWNLLVEYKKEKFWWDKWINDNTDQKFIKLDSNCIFIQSNAEKGKEWKAPYLPTMSHLWKFCNGDASMRIDATGKGSISVSHTKKTFKTLYQYYRDK